MNINSKFKDSVFTLLFRDPDLLRELYCALEGVSLPLDVPVSITTLENVLLMDFINDISFEIGGKLIVLIEHQSTINPNMPLRLLMYINHLYEKMVKGKNLYSGKLVKIPKPEFFVLYNGKAPYCDNEILCLSDAFENIESLGLTEKEYPSLELVVRVININEGKNAEIVNRCKKLSDYCAFVAKVRNLEKESGSREDAVKSAIKYCQKHGILKEFLEQYAGEVCNMLITEWNTEEVMAATREEAWEDGLEKGKEERNLEIAKNALAVGVSIELIQKITGLSQEVVEKL
jgi:predicted transposase/invertase (TIGR01784 family)